MYVKDTAEAIKMGEKAGGAHRDLWARFSARSQVLGRILWMKAHLGKVEAIERGFTEEDWYGNSMADALAKEGAEAHGFSAEARSTADRKRGLAQMCQELILATYVRYLGYPKVRQSFVDMKVRAPGVKGARVRPRITPELRGHAVHGAKDCQYCLGCGRSTKATAQRLFWKNQACVPSDRNKAYLEKGTGSFSMAVGTVTLVVLLVEILEWPGVGTLLWSTTGGNMREVMLVLPREGRSDTNRVALLLVAT